MMDKTKRKFSRQLSETYERGDGRTHLYRIVKTLLLFVSWICLGLFNEILGPTLPDLKDKIGASFEEIGRIFAARSAGLIIGSCIGGITYDRFNKHRDILFAATLIIEAITITTVPWLHNLWALAFLFHIIGQAHGFHETGGNPMLAFLWADKAAGPFNFLHAGFGIGASIAPLIANPFITKSHPLDGVDLNETEALSQIRSLSQVVECVGCTDVIQIHLNITQTDDDINKTVPDVFPNDGVSTIEYAYAIVGAVCLSSAINFLCLYATRKWTPNKLQMVNSIKKAARLCDPRSCSGGDMKFGIQMSILVFIIYSGIVGGERVFGKFVFSYATEGELQFTSSEATFLNCIFWISFTAGRLTSAITARFVPTHILLILQSLGMLTSSVFLCVFHDNYLIFWIFSSAYGFFLSPIFPSCMGWINRYLEVTSSLVMVMNMGGGLGGMLFQWAIGYLFERVGPESFPYIILVSSIMTVLLIIIAHVVASRHGERFLKPEEVGVNGDSIAKDESESDIEEVFDKGSLLNIDGPENIDEGPIIGSRQE